MKFLCKLILCVFILFLATPTIVIVINKDIDTSYFFDMSEEEENLLSFNEIKTIPSIYSIPIIIDFEGFQKVVFLIFNDRKVISITPNIFLPPPKLV